MARHRISAGKRARLRALSTPRATIAALAIDQRKSLRKMIANAAGKPPDAIADAQLAEFKMAVTECLSRYASAILLDPEYGLEAAKRRSPGCGLLLTYESDGFENPRPHRMLQLMPHASVRRLKQEGADAIKILLSWAPEGDAGANEEKRAMVERIGAECEALEMPFLLEPVVYDPAGAELTGFEFARRKPALVVRTMEEFSNRVYGVDVLKVEFPVNAAYVEGSAAYCGARAQGMEEALDWFRRADAAARLPYIYLSAGVGAGQFLESLRMAAGSGARFSGVLCGRANWQGGVPEYVRGGREALERWLFTDGAENLRRVNDHLAAAGPWTEWFEEAASA